MRHPSESTMRALFAEDAVHVADGGGLARATLHPLHGAERLARLYLQLARQARKVELRYELRTLNGAPALLCWLGPQLFYAMWIDCEDGRITSIHTIRHPGKLARIEAVTKSGGGASLH
jgi:RNA polymerase sigma-70 factor (ECF subfamily)